MEEINCKAYNAFIAIRVLANTSTIIEIANYKKHEIEITTHRKYAAPNRAQLSDQGCRKITAYK